MVKRNRYATGVSLFAALGSITYGYGASIIAQTIGQPQWYEYFNLAQEGPGLAHTNVITGLMNGLFSTGGALGALFTAWTTHAFGRLRTIQFACAVCIVGGSLMTGAANIAMFQASRFIMGWGIGMMVCGVPLYQSELATPTHRGRHIGFHGMALATGYALTGFIGFGCYYDSNSSFQWRFPFAVQLIPVLILLAGSAKLPESPRWLLSNGRKEHAWRNLQRLHANPDDPDDTFARKEFYQMTQQFLLEQQRREQLHIVHWWDFFRRKSFLHRVAIGMGSQLINVGTGNLVVNNYQVSLYQRLGVKGAIPILLIAFWNCVGMWGNTTSAFFIMDKYGRKPFYMLGIAGCGVSLIFEAALTKYYVQTGSDNKVGLGFGVFFIFLYVAFYSSCMDNQQYVICSEVFPMETRGLGVALSLFGQFAGTALFVGVAPTSFAAIGWKFYMVFVCLCIVNVIIVWRFYPETKGLSLEEIDELFGDPVAVHLTDANKDQMEELERQVREFSMPNGSGSVEMPDSESKGMEEENEHVERTSFQGKK
ncbi:general substrate transporter [Trematosphaeria pertusa]|uniref:General substrate transporter n=1 Tax=Trematosphaeria pertusa TaxID=390896 RepID=A0A6A6IL41_9PLEO|nr:general substrate transporter [Trematosphaeria pertusa]KAF2250929.1 general substrate transporter [Trematosphaeria pertusa]